MSETAPTELTLEQFKKIVMDAVERFQGKFTPDPDTEESVSSSDFVYKNFNDKIDVMKLTVKSMNDFPDQFKIVTEKGKNVIVEIKTRTKADALLKYIQKYKSLPKAPDPQPPVDHGCTENQVWSEAEQKCVEKSPETDCPPGKVRDPATGECVDKPVDPNPDPTPGAGEDMFGTKTVYPTTGRMWKDFRLNPNAGLRFDFKGKPSDCVNVELTGYFAIGSAPDDEGSGKFSNERHSDGTHPHCYDMGIDNHTGETRIRYEDPHPNYTSALATGKKGLPLTSKFQGMKYIRTTMPDGNVKLEMWQDQGNNDGDKPANQWVKLLEYVDSKYKITDYPIGVEATLRYDGDNIESDLKYKWISMVEIKPTTS